MVMVCRGSIGMIALALALGAVIAGAGAQGGSNSPDLKYPDWRGQWVRIGGEQFDPSKPQGLAQQAPLTAEYQALYAATLAGDASGRAPDNAQAACAPPGMPRMMIGYQPVEIVITGEVTYVMSDSVNPLRRIYTDGRAWPTTSEPTFTGFSIGQWEDTDGDGRYDTLAIETRGLRGPRAFDTSGLPLHEDNATVVKERISLDKVDRNVLRNEITTIDHALTHPWTVTRTYRRESNPAWLEYNCGENLKSVVIRGETYQVSDDGYLMPGKKDQPQPDLRYFKQPGK
jgi:hypothetical protein